ncbi:MAG: hypothetical protein CVU03_05970 [Bacteroidetes bacterium HGW-Bacteroidetes-2]|jgi:cytoskeletal protein RodZ|nr:MAG: hypothetical protein CVU03_05970 [Bacteroidetes bacterium HGW-Bacteroidetes-2]
MELNKLDTQIKNKLEQREILPSPKSWEQLREQLDTNDKKSTISFWSIGIAASILAGILVASLVFTNITSQKKPMLVETNQEAPIKNKQQIVIANDVKTTKKTYVNHPVKISKVKTTKKAIVSQENENSTTPLLVLEEVEVLQKTMPEEMLHINQKIEEILSNIAEQDLKNTTLTDAEVDSLLLEAATKIWKNNRASPNSAGITAFSLLNSVEEELDQTFRERIFEMLKDGFLKTKEAVANRNN